jgi:hypothetical protein
MLALPNTHYEKKANALDENKISPPPRLMQGIPLKKFSLGRRIFAAACV